MTVTHQHTNHAHAILLSQVASGHCFNQRVSVPLRRVNVSKTESVKRVSCIFADYKNPPALYGAERPLFYGMSVKRWSEYRTSQDPNSGLKLGLVFC